MSLEPHITQRALAKLLSVSVKTLGEWRRSGKGPSGWWRLNLTTIVYPQAEVERWIEIRKAASRELEGLDATKTAFLEDYRRKRAQAREAAR